MIKYFKVGQVVYSINGIQGKVVSINDSNYMHPIKVDFGNTWEWYTSDGRRSSVTSICLFQTQPTITQNVPILEFEKLERVWVKDDDIDYWDARFFSHVENDIHFCFELQKKDGNVNSWQQIRKLSDVPF